MLKTISTEIFNYHTILPTINRLSEELQIKQLKHLSHIEDLIIEEGWAGKLFAENLLEMFKNGLRSNTPETKISISVKFDGAPSVIFSKTEEKGFFIATKSAFNKNPKLNYSEQDIDKNHGQTPELAQTLKYIFYYLKNHPFTGTYQGDLLYTKEDLKIRADFPGTSEYYITFRPNILIYAFPLNSEMGQRIKQSQLGIVVHTKYATPDLQNPIFDFNYQEIPSSKDVIIFSPEIPNVAGEVTLTKEETSFLIQALKDLRTLPISQEDLENIPELLRSLLSSYKNFEIRQNQNPSLSGLQNYIQTKYQNEINKKTTSSAKQKLQAELTKLLDFIHQHSFLIGNIYEWQEICAQAKQILLDKLNSFSEHRNYLEFKNGELVVTGNEGFVVSDAFGNVVKLVDRFKFSQINFGSNVKRGWEK